MHYTAPPLERSEMTMLSVGTLLLTSKLSTLVGSKGTQTLPIWEKRIIKVFLIIWGICAYLFWDVCRRVTLANDWCPWTHLRQYEGTNTWTPASTWSDPKQLRMTTYSLFICVKFLQGLLISSPPLLAGARLLKGSTHLVLLLHRENLDKLGLMLWKIQ